MDNLKIEGTKKTPNINFDSSSGVLSIMGRSVPEDTYEFFQPIMQWIDTYSLTPGNETLVKIQLDYFNTSSSKFLLELLKKIKSIQTKNTGANVKIEWCYDDGDEEMKESGHDFMDLLNINFEFICISA
jgi:hypothetical protein